MTEKSPAFQFYPKDFLTDEAVDLMTLEQRGAYITLLCKQWLNGSIPSNEDALKSMCGNPGNWDEVWFGIGSCFVQNDEGRLVNPRLEKERKKQKEWRTKSRLGGVKSGESRRKKKMKGGSQMVEPKHEPNTNTSSSSSSSTKNKRPTAKAVSGVWLRLSHWYHTKQLEYNPVKALTSKFDKTVQNGAETLERLHRIDKWDESRIREVLQYALDDSGFWRDNMISLAGCRVKGNNDMMKIENVELAMKRRNGKSSISDERMENVRKWNSGELTDED